MGVYAIFYILSNVWEKTTWDGEIGMVYRSVVVMWSYWPPVRRGTQDDPMDDQYVADDLVDAVAIGVELQKQYGAQLRYVTVSLQIV